MVQYDMLVVKPNNPEERGRISSEQVHVMLASMLTKCEDENYLCGPATWFSRSRTSDEAVEIGIPDTVAGLIQWKRFREFEGRIQERPQQTTHAVQVED